MIQSDMKACGLPIRTEYGVRAYHSLRNSYISMLLESTDIATAQKLARHCDINLTLSYARLRPESERTAISLLDLPALPEA